MLSVTKIIHEQISRNAKIGLGIGAGLGAAAGGLYAAGDGEGFDRLKSGVSKLGGVFRRKTETPTAHSDVSSSVSPDRRGQSTGYTPPERRSSPDQDADAANYKSMRHSDVSSSVSPDRRGQSTGLKLKTTTTDSAQMHRAGSREAIEARLHRDMGHRWARLTPNQREQYIDKQWRIENPIIQTDQTGSTATTA
jgi:hypothetical protein